MSAVAPKSGIFETFGVLKFVKSSSMIPIINWLRSCMSANTTARMLDASKKISSSYVPACICILLMIGLPRIVARRQKTEAKQISPLRSVTAGYSITSSVLPEKGLHYAGHPITELIDYSPEEIIYLLYQGRFAKPNELHRFKETLANKAYLPHGTLENMNRIAAVSDPMDLLSASLLIVGALTEKHDYKEDCLNIIAQMPIIVATMINDHAGWDNHIISMPKLGYVENFFNILGLPEKNASLLEILKLFTILHFDHGGGNFSTFVAGATASGPANMYSVVSSGINALSDTLHGGANQKSLLFIETLCQELGDDPADEAIELHLRDILKNTGVLYGFGHAVLRVEDPRATILYDYAQKHFPEDPYVKMALRVRILGQKILIENKRLACPFANVDAISGVLLYAAGFRFPKYFPVLFALARATGIAFQVYYEQVLVKKAAAGTANRSLS